MKNAILDKVAFKYIWNNYFKRTFSDYLGQSHTQVT